jgi:hypothetical protein
MAIEGAERVDDELEIGFDDRFERRWHYAELAGRGFMLLVVAAGLLGFLGRGPFSHRTIVDATGRLAIDYEPLARSGTATLITVHLRRTGSGNQTLSLDNHFLEPFGLTQILPRPVTEVATGSGLDLTFATPNHSSDVLIRLFVRPNGVGFVPLALRTGTGEASRWMQLVLP